MQLPGSPPRSVHVLAAGADEPLFCSCLAPGRRFCPQVRGLLAQPSSSLGPQRGGQGQLRPHAVMECKHARCYQQYQLHAWRLGGGGRRLVIAHDVALEHVVRACIQHMCICSVPAGPSPAGAATTIQAACLLLDEAAWGGMQLRNLPRSRVASARACRAPATMVNIPKTKKAFCKGCKKHMTHKARGSDEGTAATGWQGTGCMLPAAARSRRSQRQPPASCSRPESAIVPFQPCNRTRSRWLHSGAARLTAPVCPCACAMAPACHDPLLHPVPASRRSPSTRRARPRCTHRASGVTTGKPGSLVPASAALPGLAGDAPAAPPTSPPPPPHASTPPPHAPHVAEPQEAVGLWRPDQARVPQEGQDHQEDCAAHAVQRVQGGLHEGHQAVQALRGVCVRRSGGGGDTQGRMQGAGGTGGEGGHGDGTADVAVISPEPCGCHMAACSAPLAPPGAQIGGDKKTKGAY